MSWETLIAESKSRTVRWTAGLLVVVSLGVFSKPIKGKLGEFFNQHLSLTAQKHEAPVQDSPLDLENTGPVVFEDFHSPQ